MMSQGESSQETRDYEALESMENANDDIFTQYYAIDMPMTDMTVPDAEKIVDKFNRSCWTGKATDFYFFYFFFGYLFLKCLDLSNGESYDSETDQ
jgi:hypothetical protein